MSEAINPDVVTQYERETWNRCAESYLDTFAEFTRERIRQIKEKAIRRLRHSSRSRSLSAYLS